MDKESPASLSTVHCQLSIVGRVARLTSGPRAGEEWSLDSLTDFGFLLLGEGNFAIARLFRTPDGTPLLADVQEFAGTPETAFERLWHGHFRRNFFLVGMEEREFHATSGLRERVFSACLERSIRLTAPRATTRNLQVGHFEETPDGFRRILPRGHAPQVPPLLVQPVTLPAIPDEVVRFEEGEVIPSDHLLSTFPRLAPATLRQIVFGVLYLSGQKTEPAKIHLQAGLIPHQKS